MKIVNMYTDGACSGNQNEENVGGWGCILEFAGREKELWDGEVNTTNNRMELSAPIAGLSALKEKGLLVRIYSDSSYLVNCFQQGWHKNWVKNGWKTSQKKPVENRELWEKLLSLMEGQTCEFYLVKGHLKLTDRDERGPKQGLQSLLQPQRRHFFRGILPHRGLQQPGGRSGERIYPPARRTSDVKAY